MFPSLIQYALIVPSLSRPHTSNLPSLSPSPSSLQAVEARISDYLGQLGTRNTKREYNVRLILAVVQ